MREPTILRTFVGLPNARHEVLKIDDHDLPFDEKVGENMIDIPKNQPQPETLLSAIITAPIMQAAHGTLAMKNRKAFLIGVPHLDPDDVQDMPHDPERASDG